MFRRNYPPELLAAFARRTEAAGFDELWVVEDLGFHGAFSQCAAALSVTESLTVGLGIAPAVVRNAAFLAMEWTTTARMFPGRFHLGLGHGVDSWIEQVGETPSSWLRSLEEIASTAKRLVVGENVSFDGTHVHLDNVELVHPVVGAQPLLSFGVRQPKSIALAGRVADGVILAECSGPAYVAQTRAAIGPDSRLTVFLYATPDVAAARSEIDTRLSQGRFASQLKVYEGSVVDLYTELLVSGNPTTWIDQTQRWVAAGADAIVWVPLMAEQPEALEVFEEALRHN